MYEYGHFLICLNIYIYMFCLLSFRYVCLQRERKTAKWVGIAFHQPMCSATTGCSCLLTGCRCWSSRSSWHHSLMHPRICWAAQHSLGGRWSLPTDLLCQGDPEWEDMGLCSALCSLPWEQEGALVHSLCLSSPWNHSSHTEWRHQHHPTIATLFPHTFWA